MTDIQITDWLADGRWAVASGKNFERLRDIAFRMARHGVAGILVGGRIDLIQVRRWGEPATVLETTAVTESDLLSFARIWPHFQHPDYIRSLLTVKASPERATILDWQWVRSINNLFVLGAGTVISMSERDEAIWFLLGEGEDDEHRPGWLAFSDDILKSLGIKRKHRVDILSNIWDRTYGLLSESGPHAAIEAVAEAIIDGHQEGDVLSLIARRHLPDAPALPLQRPIFDITLPAKKRQRRALR